MLNITQPQSFILLLLCFAVMFTTFFKAKFLRKLPTIRKMPALDAVDEAIGRALEQGKKFHCGMTSSSDPTSPGSAAHHLASLALCSYVAHRAAKVGVPTVYTAAMPYWFVAFGAAIKQAYIIEGNEELLSNPEMVKLELITGRYEYGIMGIFKRENVASTFFAGTLGSTTLNLGEAAIMYGIFSIICMPDPVNLALSITSFDYSLIVQEVYAAGAAIKGEPIELSAVEGMDVITWGLCALMIVFVALATAGFNLTKLISG